MDYKKLEEEIINWLKDYAKESGTKGFVIGISGGIDSAVASTLCAKTGLSTIVLEIPINKKNEQFSNSKKHISWLKKSFSNVTSFEVNLTESFNSFIKGCVNNNINYVDYNEENRHLTQANTQSRLRMVALYFYAGLNKCLVCGTGNKIEDFGIGFFTKYGDGAVDISPLADLMKSEVYEFGKKMGIISEIINSRPTDGLWEDGRTDEDQIGATYDELEWAMGWISCHSQIEQGIGSWYDDIEDKTLNNRQTEVLKIYSKRHEQNRHKVEPIPIFKIKR